MKVVSVVIEVIRAAGNLLEEFLLFILNAVSKKIEGEE